MLDITLASWLLHRLVYAMLAYCGVAPDVTVALHSRGRHFAGGRPNHYEDGDCRRAGSFVTLLCRPWSFAVMDFTMQ